MESMRAIIVQHGKLRIDEMPRPEPGPYQALAKTLFAATCNATDAGFIARSGDQPLVLGHESVGRVIAVGANVRYVKEGDLVLRPIAVYPGQTVAGIGCGIGGFSEYGLVTDMAAARADGAEVPPGVAGYSRYQQVLPPTMDACDATMLVTLKETLSWARRSGVAEGKGVLIFGDGPVGQSFAKMSSLLGATPVVVVGHWPQRLQKAAELGATLTLNRKEKPIAESCAERVADVVIDAVGNHELINEALPLMRDESTYTVYGVSKTTRVAFDMAGGPRLWRFVRMKMDEAETHQQVIDLVESGRLDPKAFYDLVLPMDRVAEVFDKLAKREANKAVLQM